MAAPPDSPAPPAGTASEGLEPLLALVRPALRRTRAYEVPHPHGIEVKLDANELPFALPEEVTAELARDLAQVQVHRYPDPDHAALRAELARGLGLDPAWLLLGNGSDEIIQLLVSCFAQARPGGERAGVAFPSPTFGVFRVAALAAGADPIAIPLDPEADFALDAGAVTRCLTERRPNIVFFARPNNPTGTLWPSALVAEVARAHPDTLIVSDEAYSAYAGDGMIEQLAGLPNLLVMQTLSKIGMAALRVGYLCGAPALLREVNKVRGPYNLGALNQRAALWLLKNHRALLASHCAEVVSERGRLAAALAELPDLRVFTSQANLLLFRVGRPGDGRATRAWHALCGRGVLVRNFDGTSGPLAGCLRVTIGTPAENDRFLAALRHALTA